MKVPRAGLSMLIFSKSNLSSSQSIANPNQVPNTEKYCPRGKLNSSAELQNAFSGVFFLHFSAKNPSWWCKFKKFFLEKSSVKIADSTVSYTCKMNNEDSVERKNSGENIQSTVLGEILSSSIRVKRI